MCWCRGLVPRPISSSRIRERGVMLLRMAAVSSISTMKVDSPREMLSEAPTRVNILSNRLMCADLAGTNEPIWAITAIRAVCLSRADLPDMFGPVRMMICCFSLSRYRSLATYSSPAGIIRSMTGWRPCSIFRISPSSTSARPPAGGSSRSRRRPGQMTGGSRGGLSGRRPSARRGWRPGCG